MGTMDDCFQQLGKRLFRNEILKSIVKDGAMLAAVPFSIRMDMPSGPLA